MAFHRLGPGEGGLRGGQGLPDGPIGPGPMGPMGPIGPTKGITGAAITWGCSPWQLELA